MLLHLSGGGGGGVTCWGVFLSMRQCMLWVVCASLLYLTFTVEVLCSHTICVHAV